MYMWVEYTVVLIFCAAIVWWYIGVIDTERRQMATALLSIGELTTNTQSSRSQAIDDLLAMVKMNKWEKRLFDVLINKIDYLCSCIL